MKSKNYILTVLIVLIVISISSCSKKNYPSQSKSRFPLTVGNTWTYQESYYFNTIWDSLRSTRNLVRIITKDTLLANEQLAFIVEETSGNNTRRFIWYEKDEQLIEAHFNYEHLTILIAKDLKKGLKWDLWPSLDRQLENDEMRVTEEFTSYPFRGKSVSAFRLQSGISNLLQSNETGSLTEQVYVPDIGVIEATYFSNFYGPTRTHRVLTDYFIK